MFGKKEKMNLPWNEKNIDVQEPSLSREKPGQRNLNKIICLCFALAVFILLASTGYLFYKNRQLKTDLNSIAPCPILQNVHASALYNGGPIDWENCQPVDYLACQSDDDCIKTFKDDCRDSLIAINKKYSERWEARIKSTYSVCNLGSRIMTEEEIEESLKKITAAECFNSQCRLVTKPKN